jgi:hypothetical protein
VWSLGHECHAARRTLRRECGDSADLTAALDSATGRSSRTSARKRPRGADAPSVANGSPVAGPVPFRAPRELAAWVDEAVMAEVLGLTWFENASTRHASVRKRLSLDPREGVGAAVSGGRGAVLPLFWGSGDHRRA